MNRDALPDLHEAVLDDATLDELFADVANCTQISEVIAKHGTRQHTPDRSYTLDDARRMLLDGSVLGVQLRYTYEGDQWWDTLMRIPAGVRLVRIRHSFDTPTPL